MSASLVGSEMCIRDSRNISPLSFSIATLPDLRTIRNARCSHFLWAVDGVTPNGVLAATDAAAPATKLFLPPARPGTKARALGARRWALG
eukprot:10857169-Alexandrium_andersonii.AAC.1